MAPLLKIESFSGVFPDERTHCNVTPVHKGEAADIPENYRPISVVPVMAKVLEKIVTHQLLSYFEDCQSLSPFLRAYRGGRSMHRAIAFGCCGLYYPGSG